MHRLGMLPLSYRTGLHGRTYELFSLWNQLDRINFPLANIYEAWRDYS